MVLRAALIGCGRIGSEFSDDPKIHGIYSHAEAYVTCEDTELVAVCDVIPERLERCGERWSVPLRYLDAESMLREQAPDIVSLCTPDWTHEDLLRLIIDVGVKAIIAEKPLTQRLSAAQELSQLCLERAIVLAVHYHRRYAESHQRLKEFIQSGGIGPLQAVSGAYTQGLFHGASHWFDLLRFLVGEVLEVWGIARGNDVGVDGTYDAVLRLDRGVIAHLQGCREEAFSLFEMDLIGRDGRVRIIDSGHRFEIFGVAESPYYSGYRALERREGLAGGLEDSLLHIVKDVVGCLRDGRQPICSGEDGVAAVRIAEAVMHSAHRQEFVSINAIGNR